jgi:hypothetical protein
LRKNPSLSLSSQSYFCTKSFYTYLYIFSYLCNHQTNSNEENVGNRYRTNICTESPRLRWWQWRARNSHSLWQLKLFFFLFKTHVFYIFDWRSANCMRPYNICTSHTIVCSMQIAFASCKLINQDENKIITIIIKYVHKLLLFHLFSAGYLFFFFFFTECQRFHEYVMFYGL